jgi:hypothetical protein
LAQNPIPYIRLYLLKPAHHPSPRGKNVILERNYDIENMERKRKESVKMK